MSERGHGRMGGQAPCREDGVGVAVQVTAANAATAPASCAEAGGAASVIAAAAGCVGHLPKEAGDDAKTAAESSSSSNSILPPFNKNIND